MSGAEPWDRPIGPSPRGPSGRLPTDATRRSFWSPTVTNTCPECQHPTETHWLNEIAADAGSGRVGRGGGRGIYEVACVVCQRQCCRTYG